jgi:hypothetical protein
MNSELVRQMVRAIATAPASVLPLSELQPQLSGGCACDPTAKLKVACLVKYGGSIGEAAFKFVEESGAILKKYGVSTDDTEPGLSDKLEALKAAVGPENFEKLLANPDIDRLSTRAFRADYGRREATALQEVCALFNNAISADEMEFCLEMLADSSDSVSTLATA